MISFKRFLLENSILHSIGVQLKKLQNGRSMGPMYDMFNNIYGDDAEQMEIVEAMRAAIKFLYQTGKLKEFQPPEPEDYSEDPMNQTYGYYGSEREEKEEYRREQEKLYYMSDKTLTPNQLTMRQRMIFNTIVKAGRMYL